jgi:hypothetical protein
VDEPDDVATDTFARRSRNYHGSTIPTPRASTRNLGWMLLAARRTLDGTMSIQEYLRV